MERNGSNNDPGSLRGSLGKGGFDNNYSPSSSLFNPSFPAGSSLYSKELSAGTCLEHYEILRVLGSGGFGITYLVRDTMLKRKVVLKENFPSSYAYRDPFTGRVMPNNEHDAEAFQWTLSNFLNEARVLAQLDSPGIVRVLSVFECNATAYFSMDYVHGIPLDYLGEQQHLVGNFYSEAKLKGLLMSILSILDYLHKKGICHRDIKPGNILLTQEGAPVLVDFGAARYIVGSRTQTVLATHGFSSPEQALGRKDIGPWSDIYSLGATFYSLLKGESPVRGEERMIKDTVQPLALSSSLSASYSKNFLRTIDKALSPQVENRYANAEAWMKDLKVEGGEISTIRFSKEEFSSARKRFLNLFTSSSFIVTDEQKRWRKWKRLGVLLVLAVIGAFLAFFLMTQEESVQENKDERLFLLSVMTTPIPQITAESKGESYLSPIKYFDISLDSPSLSRYGLPARRLDRISLVSVHLRVVQKEKMCPPLYLTVRDANGKMVARSINGFSVSLIKEPVPAVFRFVKLPALDTDAPYRFSFETKEGVLHPLLVLSSSVKTQENKEEPLPCFKLICDVYDSVARDVLRRPENDKVREMLISSWRKNRVEIDSIVLDAREKELVGKLAKSGYPGAQYKMARLIFERDGKYGDSGAAWLYKAAMGGSVIAQRDLAFLLIGGKKYFPDMPQCPDRLTQSYSQAVDFLLMSFSAQDSSVLYMLGVLYSQGWGVEYSPDMVASLSKLLQGSGYDLSRLSASTPILSHWELLGQKEGVYTRMCCSIPAKKMNQFSGLRLVRTSAGGGNIFIDKVILSRNGEEVEIRSCHTSLTPDSPVLEVPINMENYAKVEDSEWSAEVIMAPANTSGVMEMMKRK